MKIGNKKFLSGVTVLICILVALVSGTFAWQALTSAINPFSNTQSEIPEEIPAPGANLHDDFDVEMGNKDVYVENTGIDPVYIRVKLQELLDITTDEEPDVLVWHTHIPGTRVADCDEGFHDAFTDDTGDAFEWTMGNDEERNYRSIIGTAAWNSAADREELDTLVADAFGDAQAANKVDTSAGTIKRLPASEVISMTEYNALPNKTSFEGWVYDTDGYAYWSQRLQGGEATGLLLDEVSIPFDETYYYAINVIMEYVDVHDLPAWLNGSETIKAGSNEGQTTVEASEDAKAMLNAMPEINWARYKEVGAKFRASGWEWVVIAVDGDNALVTTTSVIGTTAFNLTGSELGSEYSGSNLDIALRRFYNSTERYDAVSKSAKITSVAQPSDFAAANPPYADRLEDTGLSKVDVNGDKTFFALSDREVQVYLIVGAGQALSRATVPSDGQIPDWLGNSFVNGGADRWQNYWLRSPGSNANNIMVYNSFSLTLASQVSNNQASVRPALWINMEQ